MTHEEASHLRAGDVVVSGCSTFPFTPMRVLEVRSSFTGRTVFIRVLELSKLGYVDATAFMLAPKGCHWSQQSWITTATGRTFCPRADWRRDRADEAAERLVEVGGGEAPSLDSLFRGRALAAAAAPNPMQGRKKVDEKQIDWTAEVPE